MADPALGSIHPFGMALDVTLLGADGRELDMGSGFDEMNEISHPRLEPAHLASGVLAPAHVRHRELLRRVMAASGFKGIDNEWWRPSGDNRHRTHPAIQVAGADLAIRSAVNAEA